MGAAAARRIIGVLVLVSPLEQVAFDIYTPALPRIAEHFAASNTLVQNTVTAYVVGMALVVLPAGLIADAIGRKRVLLAGLGLMTLTSIGCALAVNLPMMIGLRFLQGLGAGTCLLIAATVAADCFRDAKLVSVLGLLGAAWGSAPVVAPAIGGFISQFGSWRLVFVVLTALTATVAILVALLLPETLQPERRSRVDLRAAAGVLGEALRHRAFVAFALMFGLVAAAQTVFGVVGPFLYQVGLGFSAATYGFIALGVGAANFLGAATCGALAQRTTTRRLAIGGAAVLALAGVIMLASAQFVGLSALTITVGAAVALLSIGVLDPLTKGLAMGVFSRNIGLITGLISTFCYGSIAVAMALMAWLPERSQAPLGWFYVAAAVGLVAVLMTTVKRASAASS
ncbi:MAG TPA: multidrug effflux MFS transporter [Mycobacterium sp.]|jgi:MFS transporter, DHA1 family, multidrug resistance protein|nr:multidrug effflux MFS transporter [Mycobacterium sp.]